MAIDNNIRNFVVRPATGQCIEIALPARKAPDGVE